jgi:hypothetical protein
MKVLCTYDTGQYTGFTSGLLEVNDALIAVTEYDIFSIDPTDCHQNWRTHEDYQPATRSVTPALTKQRMLQPDTFTPRDLTQAKPENHDRHPELPFVGFSTGSGFGSGSGPGPGSSGPCGGTAGGAAVLSAACEAFSGIAGGGLEIGDAAAARRTAGIDAPDAVAIAAGTMAAAAAAGDCRGGAVGASMSGPRGIRWATGTRHSKASSRPVAGDTGSQVSATSPSAVQAGA